MLNIFKRFARRFKNRLKACFRFKDMWSWEYESCERCGSCFRVAYLVKDDVWNSVYGSKNGCLCPNCFLEVASKKSISITPDSFKWLCLFNGDEPSFDVINKFD